VLMVNKWSATQLAIMGTFALMVIALFYQPISAMVTLWLTTDTYMHGMLVLPLAAIMAEQRGLPNHRMTGAPWPQCLILGLGWASLYLIGYIMQINVIMQAAIVAIIPFVVLVLYGWRTIWHYKVPLGLLFLAVPVGDFLVPWLQSITADMSVAMLRFADVSVLRNGWYISIANADFRVAEACSGINFLISTFVLAVFYSFSYMEKSWKRVVFISLGALVPLVANGVRVFLIIMIAEKGNVEAATGFDHLVYGWVFFVVILVVLFVLGHYWRDPAPVRPTGAFGLPDKLPGLRIKGVFLLVVITAAGSMYYNVLAKIAPLSSVVVDKGPWEKGDPLGLVFANADSRALSTGDGYRYYVARYDNEMPEKKLFGYHNQLFDKQVWSIADQYVQTFNDGSQASTYVLKDLRGNVMKLYVRYKVNNTWQHGVTRVKWAQLVSRLTMQDFGGEAHVVFTSSLDAMTQWPQFR
jgi:exosortase A